MTVPSSLITALWLTQAQTAHLPTWVWLVVIAAIAGCLAAAVGWSKVQRLTRNGQTLGEQLAETKEESRKQEEGLKNGCNNPHNNKLSVHSESPI